MKRAVRTLLECILVSIIVLLNYLYVTSEQAKVEKLENQVEMQDLTIDTLKTLMNERFTTVETNFEAINSGKIGSMISIFLNWSGGRKL